MDERHKQSSGSADYRQRIDNAYARKEQERNDAWRELQSRFHIGQAVSGVVTQKERFGVFIDLGEQFVGLLEFMNMRATAGDTVEESEYPDVGETVRARIIQFCDRNRQIRLSQQSEMPGGAATTGESHEP